MDEHGRNDTQQQECVSTERAFEAEPVPSLPETITPRSLVVSLILGVALSAVAMKINLNSGILPSLNVPAGLLGFYLCRAWIRILDCSKVTHLPFTRQENTVIQTCVVACTSITFSGGFGTFDLAMGRLAAGPDANDARNVVDPSTGRLIAFLFLVSFAGLFIILPLRTFMIIHHRLTFPSGTATAHLINSFHTPLGAKEARRQVEMLFRSFGGTVVWSFFQWFFTAGRGCGFKTFPVFGLEAYKRGFYFDFAMSNVGIGMVCPRMITVSMLVGTFLVYGIIVPYLESKEGHWYEANLGSTSLRGIRGYKVFIGVSIILADGIFNLLTIMASTLCAMYERRRQPLKAGPAHVPFQCLNDEEVMRSFDDRRRGQVFIRDQIPNSVCVGCYGLLSLVSVLVIPYLYPQLGHLQIAAIYLAMPVFAFCDTYGFGMTDMNLASTYSKLAMLIFGSWVGLSQGGVIAALVACGVVMGTMCVAGDLMQAMKTGYMTLTAPKAVLISQAAGTALGCVVNPLLFWVYNNKVKAGAMDIADFPYAKVFRSIAVLGAGEAGLPANAVDICRVVFAAALALSALREATSKMAGWRGAAPYVPSPVGVAIAFFVTPRMTIDMFAGAAAVWVWERVDARRARAFSSSVASGLICGDGIGTVLSSVMTFTHAKPPMCIKFVSAPDNVRLDAFLATLQTSSS